MKGRLARGPDITSHLESERELRGSLRTLQMPQAG